MRSAVRLGVYGALKVYLHLGRALGSTHLTAAFVQGGVASAPPSKRPRDSRRLEPVVVHVGANDQDGKHESLSG